MRMKTMGVAAFTLAFVSMLVGGCQDQPDGPSAAAATTADVDPSTPAAETETAEPSPAAVVAEPTPAAADPAPVAVEPPPPAADPAPPAPPAAAPAAATDPQFGTCKEANAAGYGNYVQGVDPEYDWYQDRDHDGTVCEKK
jgi:hypothetical protein